MKNILLLSVFFFLIFPIMAQNPLSSYSLQELTQKRAEAEASKSTSKVAVYDEAIKLKKELNAALKVEDYEKAEVLKEKLKNLKITDAPSSSKSKELQDAIAKAVANEDFEKAAALKKELEALKNGTSKTPVSKVSTTTTGTNSATSKGTITTQVPENTTSQNDKLVSVLTQKDIYGTSATWMGIDFSLFNFLSIKKSGEEELHIKYIPIWQKLFSKEIPDEKLGKWLSKTNFVSDCNYSENLYTQTLNRKWILSNGNSLTNDQIQAHLQTYKSNNHGLGLVLLPGLFDEITARVSLYVVWFDLDTRTIVHLQEISVKSPPSTMTARWLNGLVESTKKYVDDYFKKYQRENMVIEKKEPVERTQKKPASGGLIRN